MFGFSFLNSLFLWGVTAASIPVIIHLIKRNKAVKLPFAAIRFLQIEPNQRVKSQKLKQLILLLMRMAALALLALAFARPFMAGVGAGGIWGEKSKAAVVLIDNSFSMGYDNRMEEAKTEARNLIQSLKSGDEATVMRFSEKAEAIGRAEEQFEFLARQIESRITLSNRSTNFMTAVQAAETVLLEATQDAKVIYLISDFQETGRTASLPTWTLQPGLQLVFVPVGSESASNVAIKEVHLGSNQQSGRKRNVLVRIHNFGSDSKKASLLLNLNDRTAARRSVELFGDEEKIIEFKDVRFPKGTVSGRIDVEVEGEQLAQDNQYFFVLETKTTTQILAVNGETNTRDATKDELFFVERAINLPKLAKYSLVKTEPHQLNREEFSDYRAVLLVNVKDIDRETLERLGYYVRGGGGLIMALGDRVNPTIYNQLFRDLSPAEITNQAFASIERDNGVILAEVDYQHPIFRVFSQPGHGDPSIAQFYQYLHSRPHQPELVLAAFDDGSPALLERKVGDGKVILFTSSFDTEWTNLPVKAIFLPMLYQTLQYVVAEEKGQKAYLVGQPIALKKFSEQQLQKKHIQATLPSGEEIDLEKQLFGHTQQPGIYQISRKGNSRPLTTFAVNVDARESDLTRIEMEELENVFIVPSENQVKAAAISSPNMAQNEENRQKVWRLVLLAVILLLTGETWLANRTYR
jgi:hypothetical protein